MDNKTSISLIVPGRSQIVTEKTDPYSDMVDLAVDLGADGVDLDYEEFCQSPFLHMPPDKEVLFLCCFSLCLAELQFFSLHFFFFFVAAGHADYFKVGDGPWTLPQTVYKYAAIARTFMLHIQAKAPLMKLSTASAAVGGWSTNWWGGNLKGEFFLCVLYSCSNILF